MPKRTFRRTEAMSPGEQPWTLRVRSDKGGESLVGVTGMTRSSRFSAPPRRSPELFRQVRAGREISGTGALPAVQRDPAAGLDRRPPGAGDFPAHMV
jgi:hypothetical protein